MHWIIRAGVAAFLVAVTLGMAAPAIAQTPGPSYDWAACWPSGSSTTCAVNGSVTCTPWATTETCTFTNGQDAACGYGAGSFDCSPSDSALVFCYTPEQPPPAGDLQYGPDARVCYPVAANNGFTVTPMPGNFGEQLLNTTSAVMSVSFSNQTGQTVYPFSTGVGNPGSGFAVVNDGCGVQSLAAGAACTATFTFTPTAGGHYRSTPSMGYMLGGQGHSASYELDGDGVTQYSPAKITFSQSSLAFSTTLQYGQPSAQLATYVQNTGFTDLSVSSIAASAPDFVISSNACGATIPARGGKCLVYVKFAPAAIGNRTGGLTVTGNAANSPATLQLSGAAIAPTFNNGPIDEVNYGGRTDSVTTTATSEGTTDSSSQAKTTPPGNGVSSVPLDGPAEGCDTDYCETVVVTGQVPGRPGGSTTPNMYPVGVVPRETPSQQGVDPCTPDDSTSGGGRQVDNGGGQETLFARLDALVGRLNNPARDIGANIKVASNSLVLDPIHSGIGNKKHVQNDYSGIGALPLRFTRTYNSQATPASSMTTLHLGVGWISEWDRSVAVNGSTAVVSRGDGGSVTFTLNGFTHVWLPKTNITSQLIQLKDSSGATTGWQYVTKYLSTENFDSLGRLQSIVSPDGRQFTLSYSGGNLISVANSYGRSLSLSYNPDGTLASITDPASGQINYQYDSRKRLTAVTYQDGRSRQYRYDNPNFIYSLTSIIDEAGQTYVTYTYDASNRATGNSFIGGVGAGSIAYPTATTSVTTTPDGTTWTRSFAVNGRKVQMTSLAPSCTGCSGSESFAYDTDGKLTSYTNRVGAVANYTYNSRKLLSSVAAPAGTTNVSWDGTYPQPTVSTGPKGTVTKTYDGAGRVIQYKTSGNGIDRITSYTYNAAGLLSQIDGPRTDVADITSFTYDSLGNLVTRTDPNGEVTQYISYDAHGNLLAMTAPNGSNNTYTYDPRNRLLSETIAGKSTSFTYNQFGDLASQTDSAGVITYYTFDSAHRLTQVQRLGEKQVLTLDTSGRVTREDLYDAAGVLAATRSTAYDGLGRVSKQTGAVNETTTFGYDATGNPTTLTDPNGFTTTRTFNTLSQLTQVKNVALGLIGFTYDANGLLSSLSDPRKKVTSYTTNGFGERVTTVSPDAGTTSVTKTLTGANSSLTDARGIVRTFAYDSMDRVVQLSLSDGSGYSATFDIGPSGQGQLATISDNTGSTNYSYDSNGRVMSKTQAVGNAVLTTVYTRNAQGDVTAIQYPSGKTLAIAYTNGQASSLSFDGRSIVSDIQYFPMGPVESWIFGHGFEFTRYLDKDKRIAAYLTPHGQRNLTFDAASRITRIDDVAAGVTRSQTMTYDNLNRLASFSGFTSAASSETQSFTYDANNNRTSNVLDGTTNTDVISSTSNRVQSVTAGGAMLYSNVYDLAGNVTSDGTRAFSYDGIGRLTGATSPGVAAAYGFNGEGRRVSKSVGGQTTIFVYDTSGHLLGEYDSSGNAMREIVWLGNIPVAVAANMPTGSYDVGFIWTDQLNTPREVTTESLSGSQWVLQSIWQWDSLPFGETLPNQNPTGVGAFTFNMRFWGHYFDAETGLFQNGSRVYDPRLGRYLSSDPKGLSAGMNTYEYALASPITYVDPTGRDVYDCTRSLNMPAGPTLNNNFNDLHHEYLCESDSTTGQVVCFGLGPTGSMLGSPGQWENDSLQAGICTQVTGPNVCMEGCVAEFKSTTAPYYSITGHNGGVQCQQEAQAILNTCRTRCHL